MKFQEIFQHEYAPSRSENRTHYKYAPLVPDSASTLRTARKPESGFKSFKPEFLFEALHSGTPGFPLLRLYSQI